MQLEPCSPPTNESRVYPNQGFAEGYVLYSTYVPICAIMLPAARGRQLCECLFLGFIDVILSVIISAAVACA